jgi:hypothetical protein
VAAVKEGIIYWLEYEQPIGYLEYSGNSTFRLLAL